MKQKRHGFTIVELLIVIVIIAILAAITIVAYNGIQSRANNAAVAGDATAIAKKFEIFKIDNGHYPASTADLNAVGMKLSQSAYDTTLNNIYYYYDSNTDIYAFGLRSKPLQGYMIVNGKVSIVGSGGTGGINGTTTSQAVITAGGTTTTYGAGMYNSGTGWSTSFTWY